MLFELEEAGSALKVGDVFRNRLTMQLILVGDVNEVGGICDDCCHDIVCEGGEKRWEKVGNVSAIVSSYSFIPLEEKH